MKKTQKLYYRLAAAVFALSIALSFIVSSATALAGYSAVSAIIAENSAPIAENLEYSTYKNVAINGTLSAIDAEGDTVLFEITKEAKKGTAELLENGTFVYTPNEGKKGKDSFSYIAIDSNGNQSEPATVSIKIKSQTTDICYSDMTGNSAYNSALCLAENGIFVGEKLGNEYFFSPDTAVTRSEFLSMCLNLCGIETLEDITKTGFYDDENIPGWSKPYIATALMAGIIQGYNDDSGNVVFSANAPISYSEAAVILNNALEITDVSSINQDTTGSLPTWAAQAAANLAACNVLPASETSVYAEYMTRADAAEMLSGAVSILENRENSSSFFDFLK